jgi:hypothetical protein
MSSPSPVLAADSTGYTGWRSALFLSATEQQLCRNVNKLHQLVLAGFRDPRLTTTVPSHRPPLVLYAAQRKAARPDTAHRLVAGLPEAVVVQSPARPNWKPLLEAGRLTHTDTFTVDYDYGLGQDVNVQVIANPCYRQTGTKRRIPLSSFDECGEWLRTRLAEHGVDIPPNLVQVTAGERITGTKGDNTNITVICRTFRARGTVQSPAAFHQALTRGLGRAKAYGCGLLLTDAVATLTPEAW